ncbi:DUF411 domain-containing protein [Stenotrophomonas mori]|uniref:DUF411 domain-containing protein n=1 Tax=Stenotrophomonas mori TaxID=2871096 RepID=A0ABT0SIR9_9GAMM|nr:DUF411 domain-containing protein [Stenotrophomonas mori]MCL7715229.1 DUF411 domain-containing protein [Stenotrophomonas mori]
MKLFSRPSLCVLALAGGSLLMSACNATPAPGTPAGTADSAPASTALPTVIVHKDPDCGCCGGWAEHMRAAGFPVEIRDTRDMAAVKRRLGIGDGMLSCHTSEIDGYVVEGHVPATAVRALLAERPPARGLVLPGMPIGSPGMESPDGYRQPFSVALLGEDGRLSAFSHHD